MCASTRPKRRAWKQFSTNPLNNNIQIPQKHNFICQDLIRDDKATILKYKICVYKIHN